MNFGDIHSHLVPGVDDGSRDGKMSLALLRQAEAEGIRTMIVTPHNYPGRLDSLTAQVRRRFDLLLRIASEQGCRISLYLGNEVFFRDSIVEDVREGRAFSMAGTDYVLTEFHPAVMPGTVFEGVRRMTEGGLRPVIAHVERIACFDRDEGALRELTEMGAYLQVNTHTLAGGMLDRRSAWWRRMTAEGYIHFLGSDAHHPDYRPVMMRAAVQKLRKDMDETLLLQLTETNVRDLLAGRWIGE